MRKPLPKERQLNFAAPVVFSVFTMIGVGFIIVAKFFGASAIVVTIVPVGLMVCYAFMIAFARGLRLRDDQTGDNFYYMGFIFTLTSLAVSLVQFGGDGGVDVIVRNFGIAVASTITGIVLRIIFNQFRRDPLEVEQASRLDLSEASRRVRRELDGLLVELASFRRTNQQMLAEGFAEIRTEVETSAKASMTTIADLALQSKEHIQSVTTIASGGFGAEELRLELGETTKNVRKMNGAMLMAGNKIAESADLLADKLKDIQSPSSIFEVSLQPTVDVLNDALRRSQAHADAQRQSAVDLQHEIAKSSLALQNAAEALARSAAALGDVKRSVEAEEGAPIWRRMFTRSVPRADGTGQPHSTASAAGPQPAIDVQDQR